MKKDYLYLALFIMGCQFTVISLICTFIFEKLNFIAYGESYANCVEYLFKFPLVIVIIVGLLRAIGQKVCVKTDITVDISIVMSV